MTLVNAETGEVVSGEIVPATFTPETAEQYGDPGQFLELACARAKDWLIQALDHGDIDQIVELRGQAEAMRSYVAAKQLGKDSELAAAEIVRRAERGIGQCIRMGQEAGTIHGHGGSKVRDPDLAKISDFVSRGEFYGGPKDPGITKLVDGVSDDDFDQAIATAKDEGNLTRANVGRKLHPPTTDRNPLLHRHRRFDSNRAVEQAAMHSGLSQTAAEQIVYSDLDRERIPEWISSLSDAIRSLTTLKRHLEKELIRD